MVRTFLLALCDVTDQEVKVGRIDPIGLVWDQSLGRRTVGRRCHRGSLKGRNGEREREKGGKEKELGMGIGISPTLGTVFEETGIMPTRVSNMRRDTTTIRNRVFRRYCGP